MNELTKQSFSPIQQRFENLINPQEFAKEVSFAMQHFKRNPQLMKCDKDSILQSVMNVAQTGLSLNPVASLAYLVPRYQKSGIMCVLEPSYQGLVKLLTDTGSVTSLYAHCVFDGDEFELSLGSETKITHKPKFTSKEIIGVYAVANISGGKQIEYMTKEDVEYIRGKSESYKAFVAKKIKSCVWTEYPEGMFRKVVIKRLCKYLPKTEKWEKVNQAIEIDNSDYILDLNSGKVQYIYSLIQSCSFDDEKKSTMENEIYSSITEKRADELISELKDNQKDSINSGENYSQTDIHNKLDEIT